MDDLEARLRATANRIAGLRTEIYDEQVTRDRLIQEGTDQGITRADLSRWAQLTETRITQIVATQDALAS
jgi:hypothetical protein